MPTVRTGHHAPTGTQRISARRCTARLSITLVLVAALSTIARPITVDAAFGDINTFAGNGSESYSGDGGPATSAGLNRPQGVAQDSTGNVYIADWGNAVIRKVDASGTITTYAGTGAAGYSGDGGPATSAELNQPYWLGFDSAGDLLIDDLGNNAIRAVSPTGTITTVAGTGTAGIQRRRRLGNHGGAKRAVWSNR